MVNNCANPQCAKPLHYLREGRIFVFDVPASGTAFSAGEKRPRHLEHYWLCGQCSQLFQVEHEVETGVRLVPRRSTPIQNQKKTRIPAALAS